MSNGFERNVRKLIMEMVDGNRELCPKSFDYEEKRYDIKYPYINEIFGLPTGMGNSLILDDIIRTASCLEIIPTGTYICKNCGETLEKFYLTCNQCNTEIDINISDWIQSNLNVKCKSCGKEWKYSEMMIPCETCGYQPIENYFPLQLLRLKNDETSRNYQTGVWLEEKVATILEKMNFKTYTKVKLPGRSGVDFEIDIKAEREHPRRQTLLIECKNWAKDKQIGWIEIMKHWFKLYDMETDVKKIFVSTCPPHEDAKKITDMYDVKYIHWGDRKNIIELTAKLKKAIGY